MKKQFITLLTALFTTFFVTATAQIPDGYYDDAIGKSGEQLRTALHNIIKDHTNIGYNGLWNAYRTTDRLPNGKVWDIYSDIPNGTASYYYDFGSDQCGSFNREGDCYNREHSIPQSWFNGAAPMYSDLFHIYPTDGKVNGQRNNFQYGEVNNPTWTSTNGSKLGPCSTPGCSGTAFEPINAYKGDLARTYFYMSVRYMDKNLGQESNSTFTGSQLKTWCKNMMVSWHQNDPVSQKEINRNNVIYSDFQHNRNPFIDCPELVDFLFGARVGEAWIPTWAIDTIPTDTVPSDTLTAIPTNYSFAPCYLYPNPAADNLTIVSYGAPIAYVELYDLSGRRLRNYHGNGTQHYRIYVDDLPAGYYFVTVSAQTKQTLRFVKN